MTTRAKVAALVAAQAAVGLKLERLPLATKDAIPLAVELSETDPNSIRHPAALAVGFDALGSVGDRPADDHEGLIRYYERLSSASNKFWEAFEGQLVEGVEIIRRRD